MGAKSVNRMKVLVVIFSHSGYNVLVERHWPAYLASGCDILGVGRTNTRCIWPKERLVGEINVGEESYASGDNHIVRFLDTLEYCLREQSLKDYGAFCFIESDSAFFAPIPPPNIDTFYAKLAGYKDQGFIGSQYVHTPWMMDRIMGGRILKAGRAMHKAGLIERGFLDRWFGLMIDLYDLDWKDTGASTYTQNTLDSEEKIADAIKAISGGAYYCHGIKSPEVLAALSKGVVLNRIAASNTVAPYHERD